MSDRPRVPPPRASRPAVGVRARTAARAPEGLAAARSVGIAEAAAGSVAAIADALPDPDGLEPGTLVRVPAEVVGEKSLARSVLAAFGRKKTVDLAKRCSALVVRGYVDVGAADDVAWGYAKGPRA